MSKKIMICDDAVLIKKVLSDILSEAGYEIVGTADNGEEACSLYKKSSPDLLIMDINMPNMNGIETLCELKNINDEVAVVMCSSMNQPKLVMDTLQAGAKDFIFKPFQPQRVLQVVGDIIGEP